MCSKKDIEDLFAANERRKPREPDPDDCCGEGCNPCVFDTFDTQMERYEENKIEYEQLLEEFESE